MGIIPEFQPHIGAQKISIFYLLGYENIQIARWIAIGILLLVISGWKPWITGVLHFWVCFSIMSSIPVIDGGDQIANNISLLLIPITLSDPRQWHWQYLNQEKRNPLLVHNITSLFSYSCIWVIRFQMAVIYFNAGVAKLKVAEWTNGTAVYYWWGHNIFGMPLFMRPVLIPLLSLQLPVIFLTWGVIVFEILMFVAFFLPKKQWRYFLIAGILFHLAIWFVHGLCSFFFSMSAGLIIYLRPLDKDFNIQTLYSIITHRNSLCKKTPMPNS